MKIYSYVVTDDTGFAPNPFWGYCTVATCKPRIRRKAEEGDWIIGTGSVRNVGNNKLIFAMKVTKIMSLEKYGSDKRFAKKIPGRGSKRKVGDNIYYRDKNGEMRQRFPSMHSYPNSEKLKAKHHDLSGINVLISESGNFCYFGRNAPKIPNHLLILVKKGPGHKWRFPQRLVDQFLEWIQEKKPGIKGEPCDYPARLQSCIEIRDAHPCSLAQDGA